MELRGPVFDLRPDRRSLRLPDGLPFLGRLVAHFIFDPIQLAKAPDKPDALPIPLQRRLVEPSPGMRGASGTPYTGEFFYQRLIGAEVIALKESLKSSQLFGRHLMRPSLIEHQDDVSLWLGEKP